MARGRRFFAVELEAYVPGVSAAAERGHDVKPRLYPYDLPQALESTETIRASDIGYRTLPSDATQAVYPQVLDTAFEYDRRVPLSPFASSTAAGWGTVRLFNPDGMWDSVARTRSTDGRVARVLQGYKVYDTTRGYESDPSYVTLVEVLRGVAQGWFLGDAGLEVPLRDATYWIERPLQANLYAGTGGYEGNSQMTGVSKPKTRGGNAGAPVKNVKPVLIDPTNRIWQYTDAAGGIVALYERGQTGITFSADTTNLYAGSTPAGQYRTDNSRGLFQLGSTPVGEITVDCWGSFPTMGSIVNPVTAAHALLRDDMALPANLVDTTNFTAVAALVNYTAGWHFPSQQIQGIEAVDVFLRSVNAKLVPGRNGTLKVVLLRAIPAGTQPVFTFTTATVSQLTPRRLEAPLDPPAYRWMVGHTRNHMIQTSDLGPLVTDARRQFLAQEWTQAGWSSSAILQAYRRPSDPGTVPTALLSGPNAQLVADALGALWGTRRRLYDITVPYEVGYARDIGEIVGLEYPVDDLGSGRVGQIVGDQMRSGSDSITLQVLV